MKQTDILFVYPSFRKVSTSYRSHGTPPIGIGYLAALCKKEEYNVTFLDFNLVDNPELELTNLINKCNPRAIGVSFVTEARFEAFKVFHLAKRINPQIITIAGGPHVSLCAEDTLNNIKELDIIVRGEGEKTFVELMREITKSSCNLSDIKGVSYRENDKIIHNSDRAIIKELDLLPFPALDLLSFDEYDFRVEVPGYGKLKAAPVLSSRGCPYRCNFCATTKVWGTKWRSRSPQNIIAEVEQLIDRFSIEAVWFVDDNFNANSDRVNLICEELQRKKLNIKWICNIRVNNIQRKHLEVMSDAGCISVEFGAESGSQRILDNIIRKGIKVQQIIDVDRWCNELGIITDAQFVISHPTETIKEAEETIDLMKSLRGKSTLQIMKIYPGTEIETIAIEKGMIPGNFSWAKDKFKTSQFKSIIGEAPLFLDQLTLAQVTQLMAIAWTEIGSFSITYLLNKIIQKVKSPKELPSLIKLGAPILFQKLRNIIHRN